MAISVFGERESVRRCEEDSCGESMDSPQPHVTRESNLSGTWLQAMKAFF
jgi:hypothetical protein